MKRRYLKGIIMVLLLLLFISVCYIMKLEDYRAYVNNDYTQEIKIITWNIQSKCDGIIQALEILESDAGREEKNKFYGESLFSLIGDAAAELTELERLTVHYEALYDDNIRRKDPHIDDYMWSIYKGSRIFSYRDSGDELGAEEKKLLTDVGRFFNELKRCDIGERHNFRKGEWVEFLDEMYDVMEPYKLITYDLRMIRNHK